jgi:hypothetical protein
MKAIITALKAPWPEGAKVGDVVEFSGPAPAWAVGKFTEAPSDAVATVAFERVEAKPDQADPAVLHGQLQDALTGLDALKEAHAQEVSALRADIEAGGAALQSALNANDDLKAQNTQLQEQLDAASAKLAMPSVVAALAADEQAAADRAAADAAPAPTAGKKKS